MEKDNIMNRWGLSAEDEDFAPADYSTRDMQRISDRVNRILNGDSADDDSVGYANDDIVDISGINKNSAEPGSKSSLDSVDISSFSTDDKKYNAEDLSNGGYVSSVEDIQDYSDDPPIPSLAKRIVLGSVAAVGILLCVVSLLVVQAVVAPDDNVLASAGIIERETQPRIITNRKGEFIFADDCVVGDVRIAGMTVKEAKKALKETELAARPNINISVVVDGNKKLYNEDNFSFTYDTDAVLEKLKTFSEEYAKGTTLPTEKDEQGYTYYPDSRAEISAVLNQSSVDKLVKKIDKKYDVAAKDAYVSSFDPDADKMFTFHKGKNGKELDENSLKSQLDEVIASGNEVSCEGTVELNTSTVKPSTDVSYLKKNMVMLAQWTTYSTNDASANNNMAVSLKACNGSIIDPGEIWSFNNCTGDSNDPANGYQSAGVIVEGSYTNGYGGGICQSSTTIFNAAVRSNLEIYERNNHTYPSVYATSGFDAAIDYGNLDLKLRNNGKYQVFLSCYMSGATLYASFYGIKEGNYDYIDTYSENYGITSTGYNSSSYRIYCDSKGNEIDREQLPDSYYSLEHGHSVAAPDSGNSSYPRNQKVKT